MWPIAFTLWISASVANGGALVGFAETDISDAALAKAAANTKGPVTIRLRPVCGVRRAPVGLEIQPAVNPTHATWNDPNYGYSLACRADISAIVAKLKPGTYTAAVTFRDNRRVTAATDRSVPNDPHLMQFTVAAGATAARPQ